MGITSDVAFAAKEKIVSKLDKLFPWVAEDATKVLKKSSGACLYYFEDVKWSDTDQDISDLYSWLYHQDHEDFLIIEACHDYPTSEEGDIGAWSENPWNIQRMVSVKINIED